MDSTRFDHIAAALGGETGRRDTLRLLGASLLGVGGLAVLGTAEGDARKKGKNKKKKKNKGNGNGKDSCKGRCGGQCPRCAPGTTCSTRDECVSALCTGGVCTEPASADECGLDTNGDTCFRRDTQDGVSYCSRKNGRFLAGGSCSQCTPQENCTVIPDAGVECLIPCGGPL